MIARLLRRATRASRDPRAFALPAALGLALTAVGGAAFWSLSVPRAAGPVACEAGLMAAPLDGRVRVADPGVGGIVILGAELTREDGRLRVVRARPDFAALRAQGLPVGIALRAAPGPESAAEARETTATLAGLARALAAEAAAWGVGVGEILLDVAGPERDLDAWASRLAALQRAAAPRPVRLAAPPEWIDRGDFLRLASAAGGWVLTIPRADGGAGSEPGSIRVLAERAARLRVPFRVALPVPPGSPAADALVRAWAADRPKALVGVLCCPR